MGMRKMQHSDYMDLAIEEAKSALLSNDVPIGCIIVKDGCVIGRGYNTRERDQTAIGHAEINAIREACAAVGSWRLSGCTLYVTLEPCPMCMGAIINARIDTVVFGAYDVKAGCAGTLADFCRIGFNHVPEVLGGIREIACSTMLSEFFEALRK